MMIDTAISLETAALRDALLAVAVGDTVTYGALSSAIGRDVEKRARSTLTTARRIVEREHGAVFECVRRVGLRRLAAVEAARVGAGGRARIRRAATRAVKAMARMTAGANDIPAAAAMAINRETATLGLIAAVARAKEPPVVRDDKPLPPALAARALLERWGETQEGEA